MAKGNWRDQLGKVFRENNGAKGNWRLVKRYNTAFTESKGPVIAAALRKEIDLGVKKRVQVATTNVAMKLKLLGPLRRMSDQSSRGSLAAKGIEWVYLLAVFLLMAGVINAVGNANQPGINSEAIVLNGGVQNVTETFIMLFGYVMGSLGAFSLYLSGRQTIRARSAEMFFIGGIALVAVAMVLGYYVFYAKGG